MEDFLACFISIYSTFHKSKMTTPHVNLYCHTVLLCATGIYLPQYHQLTEAYAEVITVPE